MLLGMVPSSSGEESEDRSGKVWPLNVCQVYPTLQRLEREVLVGGHGERRSLGRLDRAFRRVPDA